MGKFYDIKNVYELLELPVPPGGTEHWEEWKDLVVGLDSGCIDVFKEYLKKGNYNQRYASQLGLRERGYEIWFEDDTESDYYKLRLNPNDEWEIIIPKNDERMKGPQLLVKK